MRYGRASHLLLMRPRHMPLRRCRILTGAVLAMLAATLAGLGFAAPVPRVQAQAASTVQTRQTATLGTVLTGSNGMTVYTFDRDTPGVSNCNDACATTWPPLVLESGSPTAPPGLGGTLSVFTRGDGRRQVAYNDRPLYFYAPDTQPGDTKGEGVGGVWHAAKPLAAAASAPAPPAAAGGTAPSSLPRTGTGPVGAGTAAGVTGTALAELLLLLLLLSSAAVGLRLATRPANGR